MSHKITFSGYLAQLIKVQAESKKISPSDYVLSFFGEGCNAPRSKISMKGIGFSCANGCNAPRRARRTRDSKRNKSGVYLCVHAGRKNGLDVFEDIPPVKSTRNRKAVAV